MLQPVMFHARSKAARARTASTPHAKRDEPLLDRLIVSGAFMNACRACGRPPPAPWPQEVEGQDRDGIAKPETVASGAGIGALAAASSRVGTARRPVAPA